MEDECAERCRGIGKVQHNPAKALARPVQPFFASADMRARRGRGEGPGHSDRSLVEAPMPYLPLVGCSWPIPRRLWASTHRPGLPFPQTTHTTPPANTVFRNSYILF